MRFLDGGGWKGKERVPAQKVFIEICVLFKKKKKSGIQPPFHHSIQQGVVTRGAGMAGMCVARTVL